jgi:hypothetical protein
MPRTGSTLIEQMLASHSEVTTAGEVPFLGTVHYQLLNSVAGHPPEIAASAAIEALNREGARVAGDYLKELETRAGDARYMIDKMPFNFEQLGLISALFPKAKVIHVTREAGAVAWSIYTNQFAPTWSFAHDLGDIGHYYRNYLDLMALWRERLEVEIFDLAYEDLTDNPEKALRGVLDYLGLGWEEGCLDFYKHDKPVFTTSAAAVRNPVHKEAQAKWKNYQGHLDAFFKELA